MTKRAFDIDVALAAIEEAVKPWPKAAMFELAEAGFDSPFEQLAACMISIRTYDEVTVPTARKLFERARTPAEVCKRDEPLGLRTGDHARTDDGCAGGRASSTSPDRHQPATGPVRQAHLHRAIAEMLHVPRAGDVPAGGSQKTPVNLRLTIYDLRLEVIAQAMRT